MRQHLIPELTRELEIFEAANPQVAYFMLDGSHRTTALTLTGLDIAVIIYQNDADIREAQTLVGTGQVLENSTLEHSLVENCAILSAHFQARPYFMTVHQRTVKMLREGYVTTPS